MEWPGRLETVGEVHVETSAAPEAPVHRTTIWAAVDGDQVYVRSLRGPSGRWYRELRANPEAVLHVDGEAIPIRAVHVPDDESVARATAGFRRKYASSPALESMIRDEIADTTIRLQPR
jgi:hypothetical protein